MADNRVAANREKFAEYKHHIQATKQRSLSKRADF